MDYNKYKYLIIVLLMTISGVSSFELYAGEKQSGSISIKSAGVGIQLKKFADVEFVLITRSGKPSYWISRYEVTQKLYESVMGINPGYFKGESLPVEQVSWYNAVEFCNRLSISAGLNPYYNIDKKKDDPENRNGGIKWTVAINNDADGFRLPLSEEWEYAARAGSLKKYFWGDDMNGDYCWFSGNSGGTTHAVGTGKPNDFGIYDMAGNVSEWCFEWHPSFPGFYRIVRDGHYSLDADEMQSAKTDYRAPHLEFGFTGIRLVKNN